MPSNAAHPAAASTAGLPSALQVWLGRGVVRHARFRPTAHAFAYPTWFLLLPMRTPAGETPVAPWPIARNRRAWVSFHDADHGDGTADALPWLERVLAEAGIVDADGAVWLHTLPRVFGLVFKPVSFWYALRRDGTLAAIVAEVNNTFGERHSYVLPAPQWGRTQVAEKVFHVSPFNPIDGVYHFRFFTQPEAAAQPARTVARVDLVDEAGVRLGTSVSGTLAPCTPANLSAALWAVPWLSLGVLLRIHWQALGLWRKRVPFFRKPAPPAAAVTRARDLALPPAATAPILAPLERSPDARHA
jgi:DUF1365 family protein